MVKVAVAGGSGNLGLHIVEAIHASGKHNLVVLSRSSSHPALDALGVSVRKVDYNDHSTLVSALEGVHTVISTLLTLDESFAILQVALLHAAVNAGVKRFAPSEFSVEGVPGDVMGLLRFTVPVVDALSRSGLEWTLFENGLFMNYLAIGTEGIGHLDPYPCILDMQNGIARVPRDGNQKIVLTGLEDVGAFVVASLDLERWPAQSRMAGEAKTYNEIIALVEKVTGRKFQVTYVTEEDLFQEIEPTPPSGPIKLSNLHREIMIAIGQERFNFEANLNSLCPEVNPMGVEEFLRKWWGPKHD